MWCDLQFGPCAQEKGGSLMVWVWDNCRPHKAHKVDSVRAVFDEWGVHVRELPPKMTDVLQVMDLVVNGPLKAAIRRHRTRMLLSYFTS